MAGASPQPKFRRTYDVEVYYYATVRRSTTVRVEVDAELASGPARDGKSSGLSRARDAAVDLVAADESKHAFDEQALDGDGDWYAGDAVEVLGDAGGTP